MLWAYVIASIILGSDSVYLIHLGFAVVTSTAYFRWDRTPLTWSRLSLYGLFLASEVAGTGLVVLAVLWPAGLLGPPRLGYFIALLLLLGIRMYVGSYAASKLLASVTEIQE